VEDLIKALLIFRKYGNPEYPTHCEHDVMYICGITPPDVSDEDIATLDQLGFFVSTEFGDKVFKSFRYG